MQANCESSELLWAIARPSDAAQIHRIAAEVRDWDSVLRLALEHRVLPMLFSRLADMGATVPPAVQERLQAEYNANMLHNLTNAVELIAVLKTLEHEMIPAMPFKGVVLGASIYPDPATRPAGDLDLLIHYRHLARAMTLLLERGYELKTIVRADGTPIDPNDTFEYRFERQADGMVLELRWTFELIKPKFKRDLGLDWVWPRRRITMLAGAEVPDMSPEITLLVLCMHGGKHAWSRLIWICDVAQLLASSPTLDWKEVTREAKKSGLCRALAFGILLAHRIGGATVPPAILRGFEADTTASTLTRHIQQNLFDAPGTTPMGVMPYSIQLLDFRDRIGYLSSLDFLRPNERDWATLSLPKPLHSLYYLIRPFRIFWDRSAR
jgi:Uncharacterised nucleotidyltransferase